MRASSLFYDPEELSALKSFCKQVQKKKVCTTLSSSCDHACDGYILLVVAIPAATLATLQGTTRDSAWHPRCQQSVRGLLTDRLTIPIMS
ncbi:TPA: hypothetical protein N0F65_008605 [Lagenidium giganteum]|uniref:Uncharacterized protein n=1 Tax=Lagenidium giganteum TaxID=4803 RepID=A0AAV2YXR1_9STRA|nr:TPA: hypothetical protein N0F65_008605 [Lagenidium giganteum]